MTYLDYNNFWCHKKLGGLKVLDLRELKLGV